MATNLNDKPKRQGRIHYQRVDNPYPLEMIQQGMPTLELLSRFPALTSWQVCKLLFLNQPNKDGVLRGENAARRVTNHYCLRRLKDLGLVKTKAIPRLDSPMAKWEVNHLTEKGHRVLSEHRAVHNLATLPFRSPSNLTYQTINPHSMAVTDVGVSALGAITRAGMTMEVWLDDVAIRSLAKRGQIHWPMEPDALIIIRYGEIRQAFFIEVDMGTESVESARANSWSTKMAKYKEYFKSGRQQDPWIGSFPQPQVMVATTTDRRLLNLRESTAKSGGRSAYWFTCLELLEPPYSFFGTVWQRIGLDGYYSPTERFGS